MNTQYQTGIAVGILVGIGVYFLLVWALPIMGKWTWLFT